MFTRANKTISMIIAIAMIAALFMVPASTVVAGDSHQAANYIVQGASTESASQLVEAAGGRVTARLDVIHGVGAYLSQPALAQLANHPDISSIHPNTQVELAGKKKPDEKDTDKKDRDQKDDEKKDKSKKTRYNNQIPETNYPDVIGADVVWGDGVIGENVTVAVVDTGISRLKPLSQDTDGNKDRIVAFADFVQNNKKADDRNGHGTHIASIIANTHTGADQEWNGVAPGVDLVGVRVLDETGAGTYAQVIEGIQWVIDHKDQYNIKVMNLSIVANAVSPYWADPLNQAITRAWAEGIVVVTAAGNNGSDPMTIGVPGNNPYAISVGAFTDNYTPLDFNDDYIAPFSSTGPTLDGFVKPDVVAPGAHMASLMKNNAYLIKQGIAQSVGKNYYQLAGTSQSTAVVSGLAALILSEHPELTPNQVKLRIMQSSFVWVDPDTTEALYSMWQQGAGRVNAYDAVFGDIEGEANAGMDIWADLAGEIHYEGFSYYDEAEGVFKLRGDYDAWAGGYGVWSGGYGVWSGGYGVWSGSEPWAETQQAVPEFVQDYLEAVPPDPNTSTASIGILENND